jgi:S1-C subfamily serine protease
MARNGPAQKGGVQEGDRILAVGGTKVSDLPSLWRAVWACGTAGAKVRVSVSRDAAPREITLASVDRRSFLKAPRLH